MNQMIAPKAINFKDLVENSNTTLSLNIQTKMVDRLSIEFSEEEQQWYVANLYIYMNYHPTNDYPINLEDVFKMIGFANKENAKRTLKNNFIEDEDYKKLLLRTDEQVPNMKDGKNIGGAGQNREDVMLNVDTFKNLCMMAKTDKGKEIRKYYVKLENIYNQIIKEEIEEKSELIDEQQKRLEFYENKPTTHGFQARRSGYVYLIKERAKPGHYKIGMAYNVDKRLRNLNTSSTGKSLKIYHEFKSYDCELLEKFVHGILKPFNIAGRREWFFFNDHQIHYALYVIYKTEEFLSEYNITSLEEFSSKFSSDTLKDYVSKRTATKDSPHPLDPTLDPTPQPTQDPAPDPTQDQNPTQDPAQDQTPTQQPTQDLNPTPHPTQDLNPTPHPTQDLNPTPPDDITLDQTPTQDVAGINGNGPTEPNMFKLTGQQLRNKTGHFKGVFWVKEKKKWRASLKLHYKEMCLGYFKSELEGAKAYNDYAMFINTRDNTNYGLNDIPSAIKQKTSSFLGVSYFTNRQYYSASIKHKGHSYNLGRSKSEIECAKLYNQQALYFNNTVYTNYVLNDIPGYITHPKNIFQDIQINKNKNKSSKYYGVTLSKQTNKWKAIVVVNKKQECIGQFDNQEDAARAYNKRVLQLNEQGGNKRVYKVNTL
jgi:phage anti-repressor protein